jgi:alcohol dehydrogenase YqhD (iron-dependent ADH family)
MENERLKGPGNYDVRVNLMWCAAFGLNGLISMGVPQDWATHMIGHELTALTGWIIPKHWRCYCRAPKY